MNRPNIVIFNPDHFRAEALAHLGNRAAVTPNLDRTVQEDGVSFANAFCQNPVCTPSRCSFMSGWYPHVAGHRTMHHLMQPHEPVLLKTLKSAGYHVWWGGKNDLAAGQHDQEPYRSVRYRGDKAAHGDVSCAPDAAWRGGAQGDNYYSFYHGRLEKNADEEIYRDRDWDVVLEAIDIIKHPPQEPYCLFLALAYPHPPFAVEEPFFSMIDRDSLPRRADVPEDWSTKPAIMKGIFEETGMQDWSEERWNELRAVYYGMCSRVDHQYGLLLEALQQAGSYDDTAVFFFSDHGMYVGEFGQVDINQNTFEDCQTRVPLVVKPPASVKTKPGIREALVELVDFPATALAMLGMETGWAQHGRSLVPLVDGTTDRHRDAVFCEGGRLAGETQAMELDSKSKPGDLYWPRLKWQAGDGPEHGKAIMCRTTDYKYVLRLYEQDELYDLNADPLEERNRINDPVLSAVKQQLKNRLLRHYMETCDVVPFDTDERDVGWK